MPTETLETEVADAISQSQVQIFLDGLRQQVQFAHDLRQRTNRLLAEGFSTFSYVEVVEPKLSSITGDLLQPDGTHGQGDVFVRAFVRALGVEDRGAPLSVQSEAPTRFIERHLRRVDLKLVWNDFIIGIENKPWALDQDSQIEDYVKDLATESTGRFLLVYLSGDGSDPTPASISTERLKELKCRDANGEAGGIRVLSYPKVMCRWLDECIRECQAEKVRWFLRDFREYLLGEFPQEELEGIKMRASTDPVVAYALQSKNNLELASAVGARFSEIKEVVIGKFAQVLENELVHRSPNLLIFRNEIKSDPLGKWKGLYFGKATWRDKFSIGLSSWASGDARGFYFGVVKEKEREGRALPQLGAKLDSSFGRGESATPSWDWWQKLREPYKDWDNEHILGSMYDAEHGAALNDLSTLLLHTFEVAEGEIDKAVSKAIES